MCYKYISLEEWPSGRRRTLGVRVWVLPTVGSNPTSSAYSNTVKLTSLALLLYLEVAFGTGKRFGKKLYPLNTEYLPVVLRNAAGKRYTAPMFLLSLDPWPVITAALIPLALGSFWYSPMVFGNHWIRLSGSTIRSEAQARQALFTAWLGSFTASLLMSMVLALLIKNLFVVTPLDGMQVGFFLWLGFVATTSVPEYLFGGSARPYALYVLMNGYHLISLVLMGGLLAALL